VPNDFNGLNAQKVLAVLLRANVRGTLFIQVIGVAIPIDKLILGGTMPIMPDIEPRPGKQP
jgi:hypothetical protein